MRIAPHHIKGTPENRLSGLLKAEADYSPQCAWPDACTVQWGHGIIPAVPFFEAFPPGTFIRGEGATIAEAEAKAFAQYQSEFECAHVWGRHHDRRGTYLNGAGWCRKCGAFRGSMFRPVVEIGAHRKPLSQMDRWNLEYTEAKDATDAAFDEGMERKYPGHTAAMAKYRRLLRLRLNLFGAATPPAASAP